MDSKDLVTSGAALRAYERSRREQSRDMKVVGNFAAPVIATRELCPLVPPVHHRCRDLVSLSLTYHEPQRSNTIMTSLNDDTVAILTDLSESSGIDIDALKTTVNDVFSKRSYGRTLNAYEQSSSTTERVSINDGIGRDLVHHLKLSEYTGAKKEAADLISSKVPERNAVFYGDDTWLLQLVKTHNWPAVPSVVENFDSQRDQLLSMVPSEDQPYRDFVNLLTAEKTAIMSLATATTLANFEAYIGLAGTQLESWYVSNCKNPWTVAEDHELKISLPAQILNQSRAKWEGLRGHPPRPPTSANYDSVKMSADPRYGVHLEAVNRKLFGEASQYGWTVEDMNQNDDVRDEGGGSPSSDFAEDAI